MWCVRMNRGMNDLGDTSTHTRKEVTSVHIHETKFLVEKTCI